MRRFYVLLPREYANDLTGKVCEVMGDEVVLGEQKLCKLPYTASLLHQGTEDEFEPISVSSVYFLSEPMKPSDKTTKKDLLSPKPLELKKHEHKYKETREHKHKEREKHQEKHRKGKSKK
ncbi:hypothetical protein GMRT_fx003 [Giardia muris]|uniref:Uncharacterized protein n=1 Tax=Giardia muris TaxID=5742 RepID=A0A4Z1TAI5_GIAMU|nr:hypothetical protein GMRT_fx003 [Giardia muris]|eukprot:TNJ29529.1 hypothetical protein GMRT_fx003 [Giardia muris]